MAKKYSLPCCSDSLCFRVVHETLSLNNFGNFFNKYFVTVPLPAPEAPTMTKG